MAALEAYDRSAPLVVLPLEDRAGAGVETAENYDRPGGSDGGSGPHSSGIDEDDDHPRFRVFKRDGTGEGPGSTT